MIRQHVFDWRDGKGHTLSLSGDQPQAGWLDRLEMLTLPFCSGWTDAPLYYQFRDQNLLLIGRVRSEGNGFLIRQWVLEDEDILSLRGKRPLDAALFDSPDCWDPSADTASSLLSDDDEALDVCFRALDNAFHENEELLSRFVCAVRQAANGGCRYVCVVLPMSREKTSLCGQRLMELMMRLLNHREGSLLSWCSVQHASRLPAPITFVPAAELCLSPLQRRVTTVIDLEKMECRGPLRRVEPSDLEAARALIAQDLNWMDRLFGEAQSLPRASQQLDITLQPFEEGMSLQQYFEDWSNELLERRKMLNPDAFSIFAHVEWARLADQLIAAADIMEPKEYIWELYRVIQMLRRKEYAALLCMPAQSLVDLVALLLDSVRWEEMSLDDENDSRLLRRMAVYAASLDEESGGQVRTGRAFHILHEIFERKDFAVLHSMELMEEFSQADPEQCEKFQDMMRQHVLSRVRQKSQIFRQDENFIIFSMLGYVRFSDGVPDLRRLASLEAVIRQISGEKALRHFRSRLDYERKQMSAHLAHRTIHLGLVILYVLLGAAVGGSLFLLINSIFP